MGRTLPRFSLLTNRRKGPQTVYYYLLQQGERVCQKVNSSFFSWFQYFFWRSSQCQWYLSLSLSSFVLLGQSEQFCSDHLLQTYTSDRIHKIMGEGVTIYKLCTHSWRKEREREIMFSCVTLDRSPSETRTIIEVSVKCTNEPYVGNLGNLSTPDKVWKTVNRTCIQSR